MAISNLTVVPGQLITSSGRNLLNGDANNQTDNIHSQYGELFKTSHTPRVELTDSGAGLEYRIHSCSPTQFFLTLPVSTFSPFDRYPMFHGQLHKFDNDNNPNNIKIDTVISSPKLTTEFYIQISHYDPTVVGLIPTTLVSPTPLVQSVAVVSVAELFTSGTVSITGVPVGDVLCFDAGITDTHGITAAFQVMTMANFFVTYS